VDEYYCSQVVKNFSNNFLTPAQSVQNVIFSVQLTFQKVARYRLGYDHVVLLLALIKLDSVSPNATLRSAFSRKKTKKLISPKKFKNEKKILKKNIPFFF
jgi:hypothetical protein